MAYESTTMTPEPAALQLKVPVEPTHLLFLYMIDSSRNYVRCEDDEALCVAALELCEAELGKRKSSRAAVLQYDAADLLNFLDVQASEVQVLRFLPGERRYEPENREWLKNRLYQHLLGIATSAPA